MCPEWCDSDSVFASKHAFCQSGKVTSPLRQVHIIIVALPTSSKSSSSSFQAVELFFFQQKQLIGHYNVVSLLLSRNLLLWPAISRQRTYGTNNERKVSILGKILLVEPIQSIQTALWEVGRVRHNKEKHTRLARVRRTKKTHEKERHKTCHT